MTFDELQAKWRKKSVELERLGALVSGSRLCEEVLGDLEAFALDQAQTTLTLKQAAQLSGYSQGHLARMIRDGRIPNAGHPGAPRILRRDLPLKPVPSLVHSGPRPYDPTTDARSLVIRRKGGGDAPS